MDKGIRHISAIRGISIGLIGPILRGYGRGFSLWWRLHLLGLVVVVALGQLALPKVWQ